MHFASRRAAFRGILSGTECIHPASVFDPISARIAEDIGFEAGMFAGSIASMTVLGAPDLIVLTLAEFAQQVQRISRAGSLPLIVDADHGYGNALSVQRTVDELETAGVAAMTIEDTLLPTPFGARRTVLVPIDEAVGKMRAAVAARQDESLVIMARTSLKAADLAEVVERVKAYQDCGVDGVFIRGVSSWQTSKRSPRSAGFPSCSAAFPRRSWTGKGWHSMASASAFRATSPSWPPSGPSTMPCKPCAPAMMPPCPGRR
jgi:carboxyvinyl-carboxyphosphonate phosphorylmutase